MYINPEFFGVRFSKDYLFRIPAKAIENENRHHLISELCYEFTNDQYFKTGTLKIIPYRDHYHLELFIMAGFDSYGLEMYEATKAICKEYKLKMTRYDIPTKKFEDFSKRNVIHTKILKHYSDHTEQAVISKKLIIQLINQ